MTTSDPVIAEINLDDWNATPGPMSVHLSDAPLVEDLLTEAKHAHADLVRANKPALSLRAAIRAIEPEWTP